MQRHQERKEDLKIHLIQDRMMLLENSRQSNSHGVKTSQNRSEFPLENYIKNILSVYNGEQNFTRLEHCDIFQS